MISIDASILKPYAKRYIWWKTPDEAIEFPQRVIAQVMNIGTFEDAMALKKQVGEDVMREVIATAEAGQFEIRAWHYWHIKLDIADTNIPPLPTRTFD